MDAIVVRLRELGRPTSTPDLQHHFGTWTMQRTAMALRYLEAEGQVRRILGRRRTSTLHWELTENEGI